MPPAVPIELTDDGRPAVLDDRALFGHPRGLGLLFFTEMWERFSYYGMRAILVLYLVNELRWSTPRAANLYGTYTMLVYLTPVIGGYLADRFIGTRRSLVIGGAIIALGHFTMAFPGMKAFYAGLGLIIIGTGFFKSNVSTMVGQVYRDGDARRDAGFTIFYMGINLGAAMGPIICGWLAQGTPLGWHWGFAAAGFGMVAGLIVYVWGRDRYLPGIGLHLAVHRDRSVDAGAARAEAGASLRHGLIGAAGGVVLAWLMGGFTLLGTPMAAIIGAAVGVALLGSHGEERKRVIALFIVVFFVIFFWAADQQTGSSMNLFANKHTNLDVRGFHIPSSWFQSVNAVEILIFAPMFAALWHVLDKHRHEPPTALKMAMGLFLLGVGFVFLAIGGSRADTGILVSPLWLVAAYSFHTWGELCLSPVGLSYVTKVAPVRFGSLLMGVWFLANAAANKIAGSMAAFMPTPGEAAPKVSGGLGAIILHASRTQQSFFTIFVVTSIGASLLMLLFVPLLKRLTSSVQA